MSAKVKCRVSFALFTYVVWAVLLFLTAKGPESWVRLTSFKVYEKPILLQSKVSTGKKLQMLVGRFSAKQTRKLVLTLLLIGGVEPIPGPNIGNQLKVGTANCNALLHKLDNLRALLFSAKLAILMLQETKLSSSIHYKELEIPGFSILRKDRNCHGGGLIIFIKQSRNPPASAINHPDSLEVLGVEINI